MRRQTVAKLPVNQLLWREDETAIRDLAMHGGKRQHRGAASRAAGDETIAPAPAPVRERRCTVTGVSQPTSGLIRFALGPDGVVPDLAARLPGRGVWVSCDREQVAAAAKKKAFARGFKQQVICPPDLAGLVENLLCRRVLGRIAMANKAGLAVAGYSRVEATLRDGSIKVLLHASDGASDGCRKLDGLAIAGEEIFGTKPEIVTRFTSDELSLAFGRVNVVHAALKQGGASTSFLKELERLDHYTAGTGRTSTSTTGTETRDRRYTEKV